MRRYNEAGLGEHMEKEQLHSIARTVMDGTGSHADMQLLAAHAKATAEAKAEAEAQAPLSLDDVVAGQFAKCRAPTSCSQSCAASINAALGTCGSWAQSPGALRRTTSSKGADELKSTCAVALTASKTSCQSDPEVGRCRLTQ